MAPVLAVAASGQPLIEQWIIDSGCGLDPIFQDVVRGFPNFVFAIEKPITFNLASGQAPAGKQRARLDFDEPRNIDQAWFMNRSPAVL